ncbi:hypothetical protein RvY_16907-5 [Ramazzottius varieornatus]|uniref:Uncharacterized protein n=1 Tax=Ramazzottius varieornatus TaxID=947166 RepID=A0A1D1W4C8_RAMVA|nr:hypothetical protein RvY_16907-5 [Ramazzottius varieornatus]
MANISGSNVPGTTLFPIITLLVVGHDQQGCYASAYKMAVSETNLLYGDRLRFELSTIVRPDFLSCATAAANVVDVVTAFYYRGDYPSSQKPLISVFPSCVPVVSEMGPIMAGKGRIQYYRWRTQNACRFRCVELLTFVKKKMAENRFYHYLQNGTICLLRQAVAGKL